MDSATLRFLQQENARLREDNETLRAENFALRGYVAALEELQRAAGEIISENDLFELLDKILASAMAMLQAEDGSLMLLDEDTGDLEFVLVHSDIQHQLRGYRIPTDRGIAGWVVTHRQPLIVNTPHQDWRFSRQIDTEFNFSTRSLMAVPLAARGRVIGVIELLNKRNGEEFAETDKTLLSILGQIAGATLLELDDRLKAAEAA
ncbi:MAG: hypothetical protein FOGNACKC_04024 [Anaerolineae bacterium]|nr:hypothetical protein [Anaerolineae bacterium]